MDLSIIIVNWNSRDYLRRCIASLLVWMRDVEYEIVVIDSASFDGCEKMLQQLYPQVRFIQSGVNLGFAKANNAAFAVSRGRNILFLNPDTELEGPAIETLVDALDSLQDAGIVGARLLNSDRSLQTSCVQAFPTVLNQILDSQALRSAFPKSGLWGTGPLFAGDGAPKEVDAVSGACLMMKRPVFEAVGMFSPDYFMYSEDVDLCFKAGEEGWKTYHVPTAVIIHHGGMSSTQSTVNAFSSVMMMESRWRFFRKTRPSWYCWLFRAAMLCSSFLRIGLIVSFWPFQWLRGRGASVRGVATKWSARLRWTVGGEGWVKDY